MSKTVKNNNDKCRKIPGFPNHKVSRNGKTVKRISDGYVMKQRWSAGYLTVSLSYNGKTTHIGVHILVAMAFIPNPDKLPIVDHIDEKRRHNHASNLQWITYKGNSQKHHDIPKAKRIVLQYTNDMKLVREWISVKEILKENEDYKESTIVNNLCGHRQNAYGFIWQYKIPREKKAVIKPEKGEVFKTIPKYGKIDFSDYKASNKGRVMNKKGLIMTNKIDAGGYATLTLVNNKNKKKTTCFVHKLVAYAFLKNDDPENKKVVNHKDHNPKNNNVENLEWASKHYDIVHAHGIKVNMIEPCTGDILKTFDCIASANRYIGISTRCMTINDLCKGKIEQRTFHNYFWEYASEADIITDSIVKTPIEVDDI